MITGDLGSLICANFTHEPTLQQLNVIKMWSEFLLSRDDNEIFLLTGYAGTGKTSLLGALVNVLKQLKQHVVLLAPTGRAAKVFSLYADAPAYTIHKKIYRQKSLMEMDSFQANVNLHKHTLFIVDEASMIANEGLAGSMFGTGRLLDDLIHFVYSCEGCRLLMVGDVAQLPPIGEEESPALMPEVLEGYNLRVCQATLTHVVRQVEESGILWNATRLRSLLQDGELLEFPKMRVEGFPDVHVVPGEELLEVLQDSYYRCGQDETIVITRSNKRANIFNQGIRGRILGYEEELTCGDLVMVSKNNYFYKLNEEDGASFIANGDTAV
ncbi:MAG: AAA family ATPase, partial [Bacteroidaceae bacterium]|nr:AAA family ATPase [Bacteroidaceae bacterium]